MVSLHITLSIVYKMNKSKGKKETSFNYSRAGERKNEKGKNKKKFMDQERREIFNEGGGVEPAVAMMKSQTEEFGIVGTVLCVLGLGCFHKLYPEASILLYPPLQSSSVLKLLFFQLLLVLQAFDVYRARAYREATLFGY
jgi:hypothetical protein